MKCLYVLTTITLLCSACSEKETPLPETTVNYNANSRNDISPQVNDSRPPPSHSITRMSWESFKRDVKINGPTKINNKLDRDGKQDYSEITIKESSLDVRRKKGYLSVKIGFIESGGKVIGPHHYTLKFKKIGHQWMLKKAIVLNNNTWSKINKQQDVFLSALF